MEKEMAPHSSMLAWKIPGTAEPGGLLSMGSWRVEHDWPTSFSLFTFMHWRRKWQPTPVFLLGESQGQRSLVGFRLWGRRVGHDWSDLAAAAEEKETHIIVPENTTKLSLVLAWKIENILNNLILCRTLLSKMLRVPLRGSLQQSE